MKRKFIFLFLFFPIISSAQTADEMAKELESLYGRGVGTTMSLVIDGAKTTVTFVNNTSKFRIDNPTDLFVSDGVKLWHFMKAKKEAVIDKVDTKGGFESNIKEIMKFSSNYSSVLTKKKNSLYELVLTPSQNITKVMESFGGISLLDFTFTRSQKSGIVIKKITTRTATGGMTAENVKIQSLKKIDESLFTFIPPKGMKVIDLRD